MYKHRKTGNQYIIVGIILAEHPDTKEWVKSVLYERHGTSKQFVRSIPNFLVSFDHIEGTGGLLPRDVTKGEPTC
jgi:hypothetical protein